MKIVVSKAKYRIYLQKDDVGIKLKLLGLNSLTIPSGVVKLWKPNFLTRMSIVRVVAHWVLGDVTCV